MDIGQQLEGLRRRRMMKGGRGGASRTGVGTQGAKGTAPRPEVLLGLLDGARLIGSEDGSYIYREVRHPLPVSRKRQDPEAVERLLVWVFGGGRSSRAALDRFRLDRIMLLDSETTGLAGGTGTVAFLVGLGWFETGGGRKTAKSRRSRAPEGPSLVIGQFFMPDYPQEGVMLRALHERLGGAAALVSYNGKSFDLPLLRTRWRMHRIAEGYAPRHFDLLHPARRLFNHRLARCSLANVERVVLGQGREESISAGALPKAYFRYLTEGDCEAMAQAFVHNERDLLTTAALLFEIAGFYAEPEAARFGDPGDLIGLGEWADQMGDAGTARVAFEAALMALRDTPKQIRLRLRLAEICKRTGDMEHAVDHWRLVADQDPLAGWPAVRELARYLEEQEQYRAAFDLLSKAYERFQQVQELKAYYAGWRVPASWQQFARECRRRRDALRQAARIVQLTLPLGV